MNDSDLVLYTSSDICTRVSNVCLFFRMPSITECRICLEDYVEPRTLQCAHNYCTHCIQTYAENSYVLLGQYRCISCPLCGFLTLIPPGGVTELPRNVIAEELIRLQRNDTDTPTSSGIRDTDTPTSSGIRDTDTPTSSGIRDTDQPTSSGVRDTDQATSSDIRDTDQATSSGIRDTDQSTTNDMHDARSNNEIQSKSLIGSNAQWGISSLFRYIWQWARGPPHAHAQKIRSWKVDMYDVKDIKSIDKTLVICGDRRLKFYSEHGSSIRAIDLSGYVDKMCVIGESDRFIVIKYMGNKMEVRTSTGRFHSSMRVDYRVQSICASIGNKFIISDRSTCILREYELDGATIAPTDKQWIVNMKYIKCMCVLECNERKYIVITKENDSAISCMDYVSGKEIWTLKNHIYQNKMISPQAVCGVRYGSHLVGTNSSHLVVTNRCDGRVLLLSSDTGEIVSKLCELDRYYYDKLTCTDEGKMWLQTSYDVITLYNIHYEY